jgi:hypothetical protein
MLWGARPCAPTNTSAQAGSILLNSKPVQVVLSLAYVCRSGNSESIFFLYI